MKILVVNPNTTESMTAKIGKVAQSVARSDTEIIASNSSDGPTSIQGYLDVATCVPGLLAEIKRHPDVDAIVIACFDDTGIDAVRCMVDVPVIGTGEAAYHTASMIGTRFTVITTLSRSVPGLEDNLRRYGLSARCVKVRATDIPVLKLEDQDPETLDKLRAAIQTAINEDLCDTIVLGCAGMADLMQQLSSEFGLPIIDGITCAVVFAESLASIGIKTSKFGAYANNNDV